jgi:trehalose utilization protein
MVAVTVWNEYVHEREDDAVAEVYPDGIHETIADALADRGHETTTATLQEPEHGLTEDVLEKTDVLLWWGHAAHDEVDDDVVDRVCDAVTDGLGLIVLHSAHFSKPFRRLMGTPCTLNWRVNDERERLFAIDPDHEILDGIETPVVLPETETYGEPFGIPQPDEHVLTSWFEGGDVFRSGVCYRRGSGRIFYFRPGHETFPIYHDETVQALLSNAVEWAAPTGRGTTEWTNVNVDPRE